MLARHSPPANRRSNANPKTSRRCSATHTIVLRRNDPVNANLEIKLWPSMLASDPASRMNQNFKPPGIPRDSEAVEKALVSEDFS
jgi:hypothetical protein